MAEERGEGREERKVGSSCQSSGGDAGAGVSEDEGKGLTRSKKKLRKRGSLKPVGRRRGRG